MCRPSNAASAWRSRISRCFRICPPTRISPARCGPRAANGSVAAGVGKVARASEDRSCSRPCAARTLQRPEAAHRRLPARSPPRRSSCCSTIHCAMSMPSCASRCGSNCRGCCASPARRALCHAGLQGGDGARRPDRRAARRQVRAGRARLKKSTTRPATIGVARLFGDPAINVIESRIETLGNAAVVALAGADGLPRSRLSAPCGRRGDLRHPAGGGGGRTRRAMRRPRGGGRGRDAAQRAHGAAAQGAETAGSFSRRSPRPARRFRRRAPRSSVSFLPGGLHLFDQETGQRIAPTA